jgi:hypothetical protein
VSVPDDGEPEEPEDPEVLGTTGDGVLPDEGAGDGTGTAARGVAAGAVDDLRGVAPAELLEGTFTFGRSLESVVVVAVVGVALVAAGGAVVAAGGAAATCGVDVAVVAPGSSLRAA